LVKPGETCAKPEARAKERFELEMAEHRAKRQEPGGCAETGHLEETGTLAPTWSWGQTWLSRVAFGKSF
jgi:hypothetical protein